MQNLAIHSLRLLLGLFLFLPLCASAQLTLTPHVGFGFATQGWRFDGRTYRQAVDPGEDERASVRPRIIGELGATGTFAFNDQVGVTGGLILQQRGCVWYYSNEVALGTFVSKDRFSFLYLAIPIGVVYALEELSEGIKIEAGLIPAIALNGKVKEISSLDGDGRTTEVTNLDFEDNYSRGDFRLFGGLRLKPEDLPVEVGARLELGLSGNRRDPDFRMANHALTIFVGFPLEVMD